MKNNKAFVLPTIVVSGTVLMIVLTFALQTVSVTRKVLIDQHAQLLAKQASESGLARARQCLYNNDREITWSDTKPLKPNTDCQGNVISGADDFLSKNGRVETNFTIRPSDISGENTINASAGGEAKFYDSGSNVVKSYGHFSSLFMRTKTTFNDITFGNIYAKKSEGGGGAPTVTRQAYYIVKTKLGLIKHAGSNFSYELSSPSIFLPNVPPKFFMTPTDLNFPLGTKIDKIFTNYEGEGWNVFYLTTDGDVYGTGNNYNGQLGTGYYDPVSSKKGKATYKETGFFTNVGNFFKGVFGFLTTPTDYVPNWSNDAKMDLSALNPDEKVVYIYPTGLNTYVLTDQGRMLSAGINSWNLGHHVFDNMPFATATAYSQRVSSALAPVQLPSVDLGAQNRLATSDIIKRKYYFDTATSATTLARMQGGAVLGWGGYYNRFCPSDGALLGVRDKKYSLGYDKEDGCGLPRYLKMANDRYFGDAGQPKAIDVDTDGETSWIVDDNGDVWSAGYNSDGQLGRQISYNVCSSGNVIGGNCYAASTTPAEVCPDDTWDGYIDDQCRAAKKAKYQAWPPGYYCDDPAFPLKDGSWCYSSATYDRVCRSDELPSGDECYKNIGFDNINEPNNRFYKIKFPAEATKVIKVMASHKVAMFLTDSGQVYSVGMNDQGQLGNGNTNDALTPVRYEVKDSAGDYEKIVAIYITAPSLRLLDGSAQKIVNSFVVTDEGEVYGSGSNYHGQLGIGNPITTSFVDNSNNGCSGISQGSYSIPQKMAFFGEDGKPKAREVRSGFGTTMIITESNRIYTVGNNSHGQLGVGQCVDSAICIDQEWPIVNPSRVCTPSDYDNTNLAAPLIY